MTAGPASLPIPVPADTRRLLNAVLERRAPTEPTKGRKKEQEWDLAIRPPRFDRTADLPHFGLMLNKFALERDRSGVDETQGNIRRFLQALASLTAPAAGGGGPRGPAPSPLSQSMMETLKALRGRTRGIVEAAYPQAKRTKVTLKAMGRAIVGFGSPHPYETGMTLNWLYGFPYFPASALKGAARAYAVRALGEKLGLHRSAIRPERDSTKGPLTLLADLLEAPDNTTRMRIHERLLKHREVEGRPELRKRLIDREWHQQALEILFALGAGERAGLVTFFDALPMGFPELKLDIINPHYGPYYQQRDPQPPADYHDPKPVFFLSIAQGAVFETWLALEADFWDDVKKALPKERDGFWSKDAIEEMRPEACLSTVAQWLSEASAWWGIGAKGSAGYGEMEVRTST